MENKENFDGLMKIKAGETVVYYEGNVPRTQPDVFRFAYDLYRSKKVMLVQKLVERDHHMQGWYKYIAVGK